MTALRHKDVRGLNVAVDYAFGVCRIECVCNVDSEREDHLGFHRTPCNALLQRKAVKKLHGDERFAVVFINLVDGADVWMIQSRGSLRLALKTGECLRVFGYLIGQELEGNKPAELHIFGLINHTHPSAAKLLNDAVVRDGLTDQRETPSLPVDSSYGRGTGQSTKDSLTLGNLHSPHSERLSVIAIFMLALVPPGL